MLLSYIYCMSSFANGTFIIFNRFLQMFRVPVVNWVSQGKENNMVSMDNSDIFFKCEKRLILYT